MISIKFKVIFGVLLLLITLIILLNNFDGGESCKEVYHKTQEMDNILERTHVSFKSTRNPFRDNEEWKVFLKMLSQYKEFHRTKLKELRSMSNENKVRTLTWACEHKKSSGMGDQLLRSQYFLLLAMMSDRLFFIHWDSVLQMSAQSQLIPGEIDWSYFDEEKGFCSLSSKCEHKVYDKPPLWHLGWDWTKAEYREFGEALFSSTPHMTVSCRNPAVPMRIPLLDPGPLILEGFKKIGVYSILTAESNETIHYRFRELLYNILHLVGAERVLEIPKVEKNEVLANDAWIHLSHYLQSYLFHFSENLVKYLEDIQKQMGLYGKKYLAVHLRTGFQGTPQQDKFFDRYFTFYRWKYFPQESDWNSFIKHAIELRDEMLGNDKYIYLSTDSVLVKNLINEQYSDKKIIWHNHKIEHSAVTTKKCELTLNGEKSFPIWIDFFLLGKSEVMVHSYSSFALSASLLKPIPHKFHSWVMYNNSLSCLASHSRGKVTCLDSS